MKHYSRIFQKLHGFNRWSEYSHKCNDTLREICNDVLGKKGFVKLCNGMVKENLKDAFLYSIHLEM
jgi:hypothetical protein